MSESQKKFSNEEMMNAMLSSDKSYDGEFFTGVKTTKIYCLPSCTARKPLPKNVVFFNSPQEAEDNGFRACKRCFPNQNINK